MRYQRRSSRRRGNHHRPFRFQVRPIGYRVSILLNLLPAREEEVEMEEKASKMSKMMDGKDDRDHHRRVGSRLLVWYLYLHPLRLPVTPRPPGRPPHLTRLLYPVLSYPINPIQYRYHLRRVGTNPLLHHRSSPPHLPWTRLLLSIVIRRLLRYPHTCVPP